MRLLLAAVLYFAIVFAVGFALGPIRVYLLEPRLGKAVATLAEAPFLLTAMVAAAPLVQQKLALDCGSRTLACMGIVALLLQQAADLAVGIALRGLTVVEQWAQLATPAGSIYMVLLILFAAMPLLVCSGVGR
jgi:hypothetical protein